MLQFGLAAALEVLHAAIGGEACRVPESDGVLHTELVLEGTQRRCGVVGPVTPGASGQTILPYETMQNRTNTLLTKLTYIVIETLQNRVSTMHTHTQTQQHGLVHLMISAGMLIPHLKEHADDGHHRKPSVGQLCRKFFGLLSWVAGGQDLEAKVARCSWSAGRLVLGNLAEGHVGEDLSPSCGRHLGDRSQSVGHICELQSS